MGCGGIRVPSVGVFRRQPLGVGSLLPPCVLLGASLLALSLLSSLPCFLIVSLCMPVSLSSVFYLVILV